MLFCDVWRNDRGVAFEIHSAECKGVPRARKQGWNIGTIEGDDAEDAIRKHESFGDGPGRGGYTRRDFRIMPCVSVAEVREGVRINATRNCPAIKATKNGKARAA